LGPNDRLVGAIRLAQEMNSSYDKILYVLVCCCRFRAKDENGKMHPADEKFSQLYQNGFRNVLSKICKFDERTDSELIEEAERIEKRLLTNEK
ncbi:MAG: hypothetical protein ACP5D9_09310, partial [Mariniphaga sp.]